MSKLRPVLRIAEVPGGWTWTLRYPNGFIAAVAPKVYSSKDTAKQSARNMIQYVKMVYA